MEIENNLKGNNMRSLIRLIILTMFAIPLLLQGCYFFDTSGNLPTITPTKLVCPPVVFDTPIAIPQVAGESKLIIALFENNALYQSYLPQAFDAMDTALKMTAQPGDKFFMLDMNAQGFDASIVAKGQVETVSAPLAPPSPTVFPTNTPPLPAMSTPQGALAQQVATQSANATSVSVRMETTKSAFEYQCANQSWSNQYLVISREWEKQKDESVGKFIEDLKMKQSEIEIGNGGTRNQVWEGLSYASLIMKNECDNFDRCVLIVFSDMQESRSVKPEELNVDLRNVEVLGVMLNCKLIYSPECGNWVETWKGYLFSNDINAKSVDFINGEDLERTLFRTLSQ